MNKRMLTAVMVLAMSILMTTGAALADNGRPRSKGEVHERGRYQNGPQRTVQVEKHVIHHPTVRRVEVVRHQPARTVTVVKNHYYPARPVKVVEHHYYPPPPPRHVQQPAWGHSPSGGLAISATIIDPGFIFSIVTGSRW
jgi:hypothetical protein